MLSTMLTLATFACLAASCGASGVPTPPTTADGPALPPSAAYFHNEPGSPPGAAPNVVLAPDMAVVGEQVGDVAPLRDTPEACSVDCRATPGCTWFRYCDAEQGGCPAADGGTLAFQDCQLLATNCSLQPGVAHFNDMVSGFPIRQSPPALSGFTALLAQGVLGSDLECPESVVPGACGLRSTLGAASTCIRMPQCRAVTVLDAGLDGCGGGVALLKGEGLSPANGFVSPHAYTLLVSESQADESSFWLLASDGEVVVAPEAEAAPADDAAAANLTAWKGAIVAQRAVYGGVILRALDGVASAEACARACHDAGAGAGDPQAGCNVFNWCPGPGGCRYQDNDLNREVVALAAGQCQLRSQELAMPGVGSPPVLLGQGEGVPFWAGAPLVEWGPPLPGYTRHIGRSLFALGRFACEGSVRPQAGECALEGDAAQLAADCDGEPRCRAFMLKPGYIVDGEPALVSLGILKDSVGDPASWVLNPTTVLYVADGAANATDGGGDSGGSDSGGGDSGGGGGLSAGAIAGITVGAAAGVAALAACAWLLAWRRAARQRGGAPSSDGGGLKGAKSGSISTQSGDGDGDGDDCEGGGGRGGLLPRAVQVAPHGAAAAGRASPFVAGVSASSGQHSAGSGSSAEHGAGAGARARPPAPYPGAAGRGPLLGEGEAQLGSGLLSGALSSGAMSPVVAAAAARDRPASGERGGSGASSGSGPGRSGEREGGSDAAALPELAQHVAEQDAAALTAGGSDSAGSSQPGLPALSVDALPARLREWLVDPAEFTVLRWPNGKAQEVGAGASAHVFKALFNGEVVAAKEMDLEASAAMQEAFLKEAIWLHALRHPHIVAFYGVSLAGNKGTVLIEYCDGRDLYSALQVKAAGTSQRLFSWQRRGRRVAYEIAKALNYLHSKGVVHMDMKSSNVLLTANGAVRVTDVGFSRQRTHTVLSNVQLVGTWAWIAPEIMTGRTHVTDKVDIYSYGVVLWEIVTGERPQRGNLRPPRVPEECPKDVADIVQQCLSEAPDDRPSAAQLLQRLGRLLEHPKPGGGQRRDPGPVTP